MKEYYCNENKRKYEHDCEEKNCNDCFTKKFWESIIAEKEVHFVNEKMNSRGLYDVHYLQTDLEKEGGYYDSLYRVELANGTTYEKVKLWGNGDAPNQRVIDELGFGKVTYL